MAAAAEPAAAAAAAAADAAVSFSAADGSAVAARGPGVLLCGMTDAAAMVEVRSRLDLAVALSGPGEDDGDIPTDCAEADSAVAPLSVTTVDGAAEGGWQARWGALGPQGMVAECALSPRVAEKLLEWSDRAEAEWAAATAATAATVAEGRPPPPPPRPDVLDSDCLGKSMDWAGLILYRMQVRGGG
jgi:hypothetical protein